MTVADATFIVTDVETTGTSTDAHRMIEIGAVKVQGGELVDTFQQLVNPQRSVPSRITRMTGITTAMVFDAPPVDEVLPDFLDFLGDGVFVAHNLSFDRGFLDAELEREDRASLSNDTLCTLRLARRLLPGLESKSLDRLIQFYDMDVDGRHRAIGDAEATSVVLRRLLRQLDFEHEIDSLEGVLAFQYRQYQKVRDTPPHLDRIREELLPEVPEAPGVYALTNSSGTPLYVGKAKCLSDRLHSHFTAVEAKEGRKRRMLRNVRDVEWETTPTELQARLRESRLIKSKKPRYNRVQRRSYRRPFVRLDTTHEYPTVSWSRTVKKEEAEYYGPVRNAEWAEMVVEVVSRFFRLRECDDQRLRLGQRCLYADMDRCTAPCETNDREQYAKGVRQVRRFLAGEDRTVLQRLRERMEQASAQHNFEKAAEFRDVLEPLERVLARQRLWAAPVRQRNGVLLHSKEGSETEVDLHFVRFGKFGGSLRCSVPVGEGDRPRIRKRCEEHFDPTAGLPSSFSKREVNEIRLLSHWVYEHREELERIAWSLDPSPDEMASEICDRLSQPEPLAPSAN